MAFLFSTARQSFGYLRTIKRLRWLRIQTAEGMAFQKLVKE